jgi:hypothetical protein
VILLQAAFKESRVYDKTKRCNIWLTGLIQMGKGAKWAMSISIQIKEWGQKEVKEMFEAVHNIQILLSSDLIPVSHLPLVTSEDKNYYV